MRALMEQDEARGAAEADRVLSLQEMLQYTQQELAQTQDAVLRATDKAIAATALAAKAGVTVTAGSAVLMHEKQTDSDETARTFERNQSLVRRRDVSSTYAAQGIHEVM